MRRVSALLLALVLCLPAVAHAQISAGPILGRSVGSLPATCTVGDVVFLTASPIGLHECRTTNTWTKVSTAVAGSDTQVQFNDGGSLGADTALLWNKTSKILSVAGSANTLNVAGAATGGSPFIQATGSDAEVSLWLRSKTGTSSLPSVVISNIDPATFSVPLNTLNSAQLLSMVGDCVLNCPDIQVTGIGSNNGGVYYANGARGSVAAPTKVLAGDFTGAYSSQGMNANGSFVPFGQMSFWAVDDAGAGIHGEWRLQLSDGVDPFPNVTAVTIRPAGMTVTGTIAGSNLSGTNTGDQDLSAYALTANVVPNTRTVNGSPLSSNVTISTITGNAGTATALQTARAINGVSFDGTAAITVTAAAGTLSGTTLASGVTASSLTSFGSSPTLVTPTIASFANATHSHQNAAGGGALALAAISDFGTGIATFLATPSSANLITAVTDETGSGSLVFGTSPTFTTTGTLTRTSVGVTSADGWTLQNTTAAAAGAQQYSPRLRLTGQGWKTASTAASQTVDWIAENQPTQGSANPTTTLVFSSQVNAAGYVQRAAFDSSGKIFGADTNSAILMSGGFLNWYSFGTQTFQAGATGFTFGHSGAAAVTLTFSISGGANPTLVADASNTLSLRNSTAAMRANIGNTFTSTSNREDLSLYFSLNVAHIGTTTTGGTARVMQFDYGGTTTSAISIPITSGDITFGGAVRGTHKSSDGTAGATVTTCTAFKDGLCVAGS